MSKKWISIMVITLLAFILVGIRIYPDLEMKLETGLKQETTHVNENHNKNTIKEGKERSFPFRTKEEEELAGHSPDKFKIVEKMYFSLSTIHHAYGAFQFRNSELDNMSYVEFYVDYDQKRSRESYKEIGKEAIKAEEILLKDSMLLRQKPLEKIYNRKPLEDRSTSVYANIVTNSEWYMLIYNNYSDWEFKEGEKFGLPVYLIKGNIKEDISESLMGPFTMIVSKETGALLDLKCYQQEDEPTLTVTVEDIKINEGLPEDVFHLDVSDGRELPNLEYNISDLTGYEGK
ncbi:hypothetical protein [Niallia sp. FSL W8-0635]|uniref:hypothetical protein n=1 Tax=Niallia sp. FSL W8-0635 TaxID=2975337 RepID=UPI0009C7ACFF|nr:Uncharacterised protein [Mycobacteroides abscessus subsp. abscessus]HEO8422010.1 hypothetical protein [Yersinia enterocolitica]